MEWNCSILQQIAYRMRQSPSYMHSFVRATGSEKHKEERKKTGIFKDTQIFNWTRIDNLDQLQKTCSRRLRKWRKNWWKYKSSTRKSCVSSFSLKGKSGSSSRKIKVRYFFLLHVCDKLQNMNDMISHFRTLWLACTRKSSTNCLTTTWAAVHTIVYQWVVVVGDQGSDKTRVFPRYVYFSTFLVLPVHNEKLIEVRRKWWRELRSRWLLVNGRIILRILRILRVNLTSVNNQICPICPKKYTAFK